jgi:DNA-binding XRE family transcriptional regulator
MPPDSRNLPAALFVVPSVVPPAEPTTKTNSPTVHTRLKAVMAHTVRYAFEPQARLARDVGVSRSTISRILAGKTNPSPALVRRITETLEKQIDQSLQERDLFSPDGTYPTPSTCFLCGCDGCLPEEAYDARGNLRPDYHNARPGDWSLYPPLYPPQRPVRASRTASTTSTGSNGR